MSLKGLGPVHSLHYEIIIQHVSKLHNVTLCKWMYLHVKSKEVIENGEFGKMLQSV